jgi:hypothetical protein
MPKRVLACLLALCLSLPAAASDLYTPLRRLYTIKTEHFTIIFPKESRGAAERLAGFAEPMYDDLAKTMGVEKTLHLPVVISPDSEDLNGSFTVMPLNRIVLLQAPISPNDGFARYDDELPKLFMHELTHAVTTTIKSPVWQFLATVFTDAIAPDYYTMPLNFIEGATVSQESRDGFGRAADTPYASIVQQDLIEGRFKSFSETAGLWDAYPAGLYYVYGGLFSRYLQKTYGMEKYQELWKDMGRTEGIAGFESWWWFTGSFEKVYRMKVSEAWDGFRDSIALKSPVVTAVKPVSPGFESFNAVASDGRRVFWSEGTAVKAYDPASGKTTKLFDYDGSPNRISVSPDGKRLLMGVYKDVDGLPKLALRTFDLERGRWEDTAFASKLREACWLPDGQGIVACRINGYTMDLVKVEAGNLTTLLKGSQNIVPSFPYPYGDGEIVFLLKIDGLTQVARMDLKTNAVKVLSAGEGRLRSVRYLYSDGKDILFSWDDDLSLYKLAAYRQGSLSLEAVPLSGGVQYPVASGSEIYYAGSFSQGQKILRYPGENPALALIAEPSAWIDLDPGLLRAESAYDAAPRMEAGVYSPLPWLLVPQLRVPNASFSYETDALGAVSGFRMTGAGASGLSVDPTSAHTLAWDLLYNWENAFAPFTVSYGCEAFPVSLAFNVSDSLSEPAIEGQLPGSSLIRRLGASVAAGQTFYYQPSSRSLSWNASFAYSLPSSGAAVAGRATSNPYLWSLDFPRSILPFELSLSYRDLLDSGFVPDDRRGFSLSADYQGYMDPPALAIPTGFATLRAAVYLPFLNFRLYSSGAVSASPGLSLGAAGPGLAGGAAYLASASYDYYSEFIGVSSASGPFYVYGDASVSYDFPIRERLRLTAAYMQKLCLSGGYRASYSGGTYLNSLYGKAFLKLGFSNLGMYSNLSFNAGVEFDALLGDGVNPGVNYLVRPILGLSN